MGKITHNETTKQNARTAIFTLSERTSETAERLYKECGRALHYGDSFYIVLYVSDDIFIPTHKKKNR